MIALTFILLALILVLIGVSSKGEAIDYFSPHIAIGGYFFITILFGLMLIFTFDPLGLSQDTAYIKVYELVLSGFLSLYMGFFCIYFIFKKNISNKLLAQPVSDPIISCSGFNTAMYLLLIIGTFAAVLFFARSGTIPLFAADKNEARVATMEVSGNGYLQFLMTVMNYYVMLKFASLYINKENIFTRSEKYKIYIFFLYIFSVYLLTGSRRYSLFLIIYVTLIKNYLCKYIKLKNLILIVVMLVTLTIAFEIFRESSSDTTQSVGLALAYKMVVYISNFKNIYLSIPSEVPFQNGKTILMDFLTILPGKQIDYQTWIKDVTGLSFKGFGAPPTIIGDLYLNWGWNGVFIGMFFIGTVLEFAYIFLVLHKISTLKLVFYIIIFETSLKTITSGISAQFMPLLLQSAMFLCVIITIGTLSELRRYLTLPKEIK